MLIVYEYITARPVNDTIFDDVIKSECFGTQHKFVIVPWFVYVYIELAPYTQSVHLLTTTAKTMYNVHVQQNLTFLIPVYSLEQNWLELY